MVFIVRCPFATNRPAEPCSKVLGEADSSDARLRPEIFLPDHSNLDFDILPHRKLGNELLEQLNGIIRPGS